MDEKPILMEKYFDPGFKTKPAVHIGSQTVPFFRGIAKEQAWEGYYLGAASDRDLAIVRNHDPAFIAYWQRLMGNPQILNLTDTDQGEFMTQVILDNPKIIDEIKNRMDPKSRLHVFSPTRLEQQLADKLGIPLHGKPEIGERFGTKSGIRQLAKEYGIPMAPGFICKNVGDVENAFSALKNHFTDAVIKYDYSLGGYFNKKVQISDSARTKKLVAKIANDMFREGEGFVVVEGWLKSKTSSPCAHIEILENKDPIISAGWQQIVDKDSVTRIGAGPLMLSDETLESLLSVVNKLARALKEKGAVGSFGPDFLITADNETQLPPNTAVLIELNARIPLTAIPLEIVHNVRGKIGTGFLAQEVKLKYPLSFREIEEKLTRERILIQQKDLKAKGVVVFNTGLLPWKMLGLVAMANTWDETLVVMRKAQRVLHVTGA